MLNLLNLEIERRYLFNSCKIKKLLKQKGISYIISEMEQFYLKATSEETLRFRKEDFTYIKNIKKGTGLVREEIENEISKEEYQEAKALNLGGIIKKERLKFIIDNNRFELDIFHDKLKGLSILEVEFISLKDAQNFKMPKVLTPFVIKEITNEPIYTNGALSKSMQIPLRDDSYISLKEVLESSKVIEPKFDLYVSLYEDASLAFNNYLQRFFASFELNYNAFLENLEIDSLKKAFKAIKAIKSLIVGFKDYIDKNDYVEILFNINKFLLESNKTIKFDISFKELLKIKYTFKEKEQKEILKILINLAQNLKIEKENLSNSYSNKSIRKLELSLEKLDLKSSAKIPFVYAKYVILEKELKELEKISKKSKDIKLIYTKFKNIKYLAKFFNSKIKNSNFQTIKKEYRYKETIYIIERINIDKKLKKSIIKNFDKKLKKIKRDINFKAIKRVICSGN